MHPWVGSHTLQSGSPGVPQRPEVSVLQLGKLPAVSHWWHWSQAGAVSSKQPPLVSSQPARSQPVLLAHTPGPCCWLPPGHGHVTGVVVHSPVRPPGPCRVGSQIEVTHGVLAGQGVMLTMSARLALTTSKISGVAACSVPQPSHGLTVASP